MLPNTPGFEPSTRENNPEAVIRGDRINAQHGPFIVGLIKEAMAIANNPIISNKAKQYRIMEIADKFSSFISKETACGNGCSHCCHMATSVSKQEAELISSFTDLKPKVITFNPIEYTMRNGDREKYNGVPCTFLLEGRCSIYPVRPMACRLHHSLQDSSDDCMIGTKKETGILNVYGIHHAYIDSLGDNILDVEVADIREYFPPQEKHDD